MLFRQYRSESKVWAHVAASLVACGFYLSTLMFHITGSESVYADDVGEYQVALPLWGTVHPTGTPLYMLLGSPFVSVLNWLGVTSAAAASLFSLVWEGVNVALVSIILHRVTGHAKISALTAISIGLTRSIWIHGSIAEVYSLWLFLVLLSLLLALDLQTHWSDKKGWVLALMIGFGVAHHRLLVPVIPVIVLCLWRSWPRGAHLLRWGSIATICFVAGFLPYLDMVMRARYWTTWIYGSPATWEGFWSLFWAREYSDLQRPVSSGIELAAGLRRMGMVLVKEMGWPGVLIVILGAPFAMQRLTRKATILLMGVAAIYPLFAVAISEANFFEMAAMPAVLALLIIGVIGMYNLGNRYIGHQHFLMVGLVLVSMSYFITNRNLILEITRDTAGLETIAQLEDLNAPTIATIMSPWGRRHFALAYALQVEHRFPGWSVVHHAEDLQSILESREVIFTNSDSIYGFGVSWWEEKIGLRPYLSAAGPGWVSISAHPIAMTTEHATNRLLHEDFLLKGWSFQQSADAFEIDLCWQVTRPVTADYSTFTYLSTTPVVTLESQVVASSDHAIPVDGWHPTSRWRLDEIVCDSHKIPVTRNVIFNNVIAGMYMRGHDGDFHNLGSIVWKRELGRWILSSDSTMQP